MLVVCDCHSGVWKRLLTPLLLFISLWQNLKCDIFDICIYSSTYARIRLVVSCRWALSCLIDLNTDLSQILAFNITTSDTIRLLVYEQITNKQIPFTT